MRPLLPLLLLVLFVAVARSSQHRRLRAHQQLVEGLAPGTEVMTSSGLFGVVRLVENDAVHLEIAPAVVIRVAPGAISRSVTPSPGAPGNTESARETPRAGQPTGPASLPATEVES
jgi:preprotein translocase subunit YajC